MTVVRIKRSSSQEFSLEYKGLLVGTLSRDGLRALLDGGVVADVPKKKEKRKKSKKQIDKAEALSRAKQLGRVYRIARAKLYRSRGNISNDTPFSSKDLEHFSKAIRIMQRVGCKSYKVFVKSQIEGLSFLNDGRGVFPLPAHLSTDGAETRLIQYLNSIRDEDGDVVRVEISEEEKRTPLSENISYMSALHRVRDKTATRGDVAYVYDLQMIRRKRVDQDVLDYLDELNEK